MTETANSTTLAPTASAQERALPQVAAAAAAGGLVLTLIGTYVDTPYRGRFASDWGLSGDPTEVPILLAFAAVGAAVVFGAVVRPGLRDRVREPGRRALLVAGIGVLSLLVFWTGLPVVLAAAAGLLALESRERSGRITRSAGAALALAMITVGGAVALAFTG